MGIELVYNELTGEWEEYKKPFCTVEFQTEEDFKRFKTIVDFWKEHHKEEAQ